MLVLRWVPATPFFEVRHRIGPATLHGVARDLAAVLAELHDPGVLRAVAGTSGPLPEPTAHATTDTIRARFWPCPIPRGPVVLLEPDKSCGARQQEALRVQASPPSAD